MSENENRRDLHNLHNLHNLPMEFMIIEVKHAGFGGQAWFHGDIKLGNDEELESILNRLGYEGWDIVQIFLASLGGVMPRIFLRRKAR